MADQVLDPAPVFFVLDDFESRDGVVRVLEAALDYLDSIAKEAIGREHTAPAIAQLLQTGWSDNQALAAAQDRLRGVKDSDLARLRDHGLTGKQLKMKRDIIRIVDDRYRRVRKQRTKPSAATHAVATMVGGIVGFVIASTFGALIGAVLGLLLSAGAQNFAKRWGEFSGSVAAEDELLKKALELALSLLKSVLKALGLDSPLQELTEFSLAIFGKKAARLLGLS